MNRSVAKIFLVEKYGDKLTGAATNLEQDNERVFNFIMGQTSYLPKSASMTERFFNLMNEITERQECECGKFLKFKSYKSGYAPCCEE